MIDFHSHVLPNVDDGSASLDESIELLSMLSRQGVRRVFSTPHFDAMRDTPEAFFKRREAAMSALSAKLTPELPEVSLGAEVMYFSGVSRMSILDDMKLEGTQLLLLEMPICKWSTYMVDELVDLSRVREVKLLLAHVERYMKYQSRAVWNRLLNSGILMQVNASFFNRFTTRRRALKLLSQGKIHLICSDCHNITSRPPRLGEALDRVEKHLGREAVQSLISFGESLIISDGSIAYAK